MGHHVEAVGLGTDENRIGFHIDKRERFTRSVGKFPFLVDGQWLHIEVGHLAT
jgi:hypothetical protein